MHMEPRRDLEDDAQINEAFSEENGIGMAGHDPVAQTRIHTLSAEIVGAVPHRLGRINPASGESPCDGHSVKIDLNPEEETSGIASAIPFLRREKWIPLSRRTGTLLSKGDSIVHKKFRSRPGPAIGGFPAQASHLHTPDRLLHTSLPLIIEGETGTGKEFLARTIHENGPRKKGPFIVLDATHFSSEIADSILFGHKRGTFTGAIGDQKGRLESSDKGTLFIDELQNMSLTIQAKLLRFLDRKTLQPLGSSTEVSIDTRILVATNERISSLLSSGRLRADFFYRIRGKTIRIPSLREQAEEIPHLIEWKLSKWQEENHAFAPILTADGVAMLQSYSWPGNIRELFSFLDCLLGSFLPKEKVPVTWIKDELESIQLDLSVDRVRADTLEDLAIERELIVKSLKSSDGEIAKASELMGISRTTLWRKMKKLGIHPFSEI